jgi:hypothetical protein
VDARTASAYLRALALLAALGPTACVVPFEPVRLAIHGPTQGSEISPADRPIQPGDRVGLVVTTPGMTAKPLRDCIEAGMKARLPHGPPSPTEPDHETVSRLAEILATRGKDGSLEEGASTLGLDWALLVTDRSSQLTEWESMTEGDSHGFAIGAGQATTH